MEEMATKYWELGNQITAFSIVQMIALVFAAAKESALERAIKRKWRLTFSLISVGTLFYIVVLAHCFHMETCSNPEHAKFLWTLYGRISLVLLTSAGGLLWVRALHRESFSHYGE
ncbi:membrane hypothetical protein [Candidatus Nitrospira nitrosa]|uniref:Uncharacterized protein n=1 Tax=Candidatus Nitrospira nitrosa TaxID=1742972 RepID=A0A0S4LCM6_9BACT|nr:hypothetical protein [Candidatus Nitrospira nitrosa]CUS35395.1 membrane hypothetical protein [Candidatus Nitrospira nitrosa]